MILDKKLIILIASSLLLGYAFGRYLTPTKVEIKKEIVTVEKKVVDTEELNRMELERNKKLRTITTETTYPDGRKEKTTRHVESSTLTKTMDKDIKSHESIDKETKQTESKLVENNHDMLTISVLGGLDVLNLGSSQKIVYGGHVQKKLIGPIDIGIFGITNGVCGTSLGLSF